MMDVAVDIAISAKAEAVMNRRIMSNERCWGIVK